MITMTMEDNDKPGSFNSDDVRTWGIPEEYAHRLDGVGLGWSTFRGRPWWGSDLYATPERVGFYFKRRDGRALRVSEDGLNGACVRAAVAAVDAAHPMTVPYRVGQVWALCWKHTTLVVGPLTDVDCQRGQSNGTRGVFEARWRAVEATMTHLAPGIPLLSVHELQARVLLYDPFDPGLVWATPWGKP